MLCPLLNLSHFHALSITLGGSNHRVHFIDEKTEAPRRAMVIRETYNRKLRTEVIARPETRDVTEMINEFLNWLWEIPKEANLGILSVITKRITSPDRLTQLDPIHDRFHNMKVPNGMNSPKKLLI